MPIPRPKKGESNKDFTSRCHRALANEYKDQKQRHAICQDSWRKGARSEDLTYGHLIDFLNEEYWAITQEALENMHKILGVRVSGGQVELTEGELARIKKNQDRPDGPYCLDNGICVLPVYGTIAKKMNLFTMISGGTSAELLMRDIQVAMEDKEVKGLLFDIDSPGGSVDGPFDVAELIHSYRGVKPMVSYANGQMTSAAYMIGSAADEIVSNSVSRVGSIGVLAAHYDYSKQQEQMGVKKTYLYSGKYKAMGHDSAPLDDQSRKYIQERLDHYYTMFVDMVAQNRGVEKEKVLGDMAEGKIFIGQKALDVGLIDRIGSFGHAVDRLSTMVKPKKKEVRKRMDRNEYKVEHPEEYQQIVDEVRAEMQKEIDERDETISDLLEANDSLTKNLDETNSRLLKLEKAEALRAEREIENTAHHIWNEELITSDVPSRLHPKVRSMIRHDKFVKDGVLDAKAFREAVREEIKDWEGFTTEKVMGGGTPPGSSEGANVAADKKADDDFVNEMLELAGEKPATQH